MSCTVYVPLPDADDGTGSLQNSLGLGDPGTGNALDGLDDAAAAASVVDCLSQEISANFSDLGKLDDSMMRLLAEGMDQQIADPLTEEHLKS